MQVGDAWHKNRFVPRCKREKCDSSILAFYHLRHRFGYLQFLVWVIHVHGLAPGAKMAAPGVINWTTFRGHMDFRLASPCKREKGYSFWYWLFTMSDLANISIFGTGPTWAGPWCQNGRPLGSKIDFYIKGAYGLVPPTKREKGDLLFYIGHIPCQIWPIFQFLRRAMISTFRGDIALHHPVREIKGIYFNIGHLTCQIWPIFQFLRLCIY